MDDDEGTTEWQDLQVKNGSQWEDLLINVPSRLLLILNETCGWVRMEGDV